MCLDLRARRCVVLGDNGIAGAKAARLRDAQAEVCHLRRAFLPGDLAGAFLAIDASGDPMGNAAAREEADKERVLLNVVDVSSRCDWIAPAVVRRGPLQVAISTSGESPFLAAMLRERIERIVGSEWAHLTRLMGGMRRRLRRRGAGASTQREAYRRLVRSDALRLLRDGAVRDAEEIASVIESDARGARACTGSVTLVGAGPGDASLLTLAALESISTADTVFHDALVDASVLRLCRDDARLVDVGKRAGRPSVRQADIDRWMLAAVRRGEAVVRLKSGDPFVFGRGGEEVHALRRAGVEVRVVPGVSSAFAAAAAAGIPLTHRGVAGSIGVVTGRRAGGGRGGDLERMARAADTLVVLMPGDLDALTSRLRQATGPDRPAALISAAATSEQRIARASVSRIAGAARKAGIRPPATLVVGEVVDVLSAEVELEATAGGC